MLKMDTTKLINSMKEEENVIGLLRRYKMSIRLKENHHPSSVESRKYPIHIQPVVVTECFLNDAEMIIRKSSPRW